ncbi:tyrosinase [Colletotrichum kahawae]|uniref:tyrosinase n=1 Tax=Colletotrichum kahawae TaxID=34407 RepID=A0AAD9YSY5_COLKA|nr:tyrosinase [Colletotrichum kahawae]
MSPPKPTYAITGITAGGVQPRREVNAWAAQNPIQLSLFIQALRIFESMDFEDQLSYYRVAGIHGLPSTIWDHAPAPADVTSYYPDLYAKYPKLTGDITAGYYCPHQTLIFPTWHRAYMLLFEQRLWEIMTSKIVDPITDPNIKARWLQEANAWRMPYWDWAASPSVPAIVLPATISVVQPDGTMDTAKWNPLYQFSTGRISTFQAQTPSAPAFDDENSFDRFYCYGDEPLQKTSGTSRWGVGNPPDNVLPQQEITGVQNNDMVDQILQHPQFGLLNWTGVKGDIADQVTRLFTKSSFDNFAEFATTAHKDQGPAGYLSIEQIHNAIHDFVGGVGYTTDPSVPVSDPKPATYGYGHMADLGFAAFDPIFWLHHSNVDRQLAIYQKLGYTTWWSGRTPDQDPAVGDPIFPFHTDINASPFNSDILQSWENYGYTYDDFAPAPGSNTPISPADLQKALTKKYSALRTMLRNVSGQNIAGLDNDFIINVLYNRHALGGRSYNIHFFVGEADDIPSAPTEYLSSPHHVGSVHTFSKNWSKSGVTCKNCETQKGVGQLSKAQVPVTLQLLQRAVNQDAKWRGIQHLGEDHVVEYLKDNLHWRIVSAFYVQVPGELIPTEKLPNLKVFFLKGDADHPQDPEKPSVYSNYKEKWEVTQHKVGGARPQQA